MPVRLVSQEELPGPLRGYRLLERLGRGGFGEVWRVEAPGGLLKAAKFVFGDLDAADEDSRPAEQELKALNRVRQIRHPYILSLERYDIIDGELIIVMELADRNLWDRYRECRPQGLPGIPRDELLRYLEEAAEALDLMNGHYQIQHLDIKPQNLFLVFNHVKVGDFGLAKVLEGVSATVTGGVTPVYAAPETFEGRVSRFSDQYSLAIVFQELLTGTRPFNGLNTRQLLMQHLNGTPELGPLPEADRPIIARGLAKKPDERWPTCAEMVRALKLAGIVPPPPTPRPPGGSGRVDFGNADSIMATRMAPGSSGRLGPDPTAPSRTPTPHPGSLPPLVKPSGSHSTPMPSPGPAPRLVTPTPSSVTSISNTLNRNAVLQTGRMGSLGIAPPEKNGDGVLFPALIVAVGQTGRRLLESLKNVIKDQYGSPDKMPNLRYLFIDTDPESCPDTPSTETTNLAPREYICARLHRPAHYLQRETLPPLDPWMPAGLLYKLARTPGSSHGIRAFGRLALFDNYRGIAQRLRLEIESFLNEETIARADKNTGLGLRSNRPRAYLLAGLAGGTGSGMCLDLAFLIRHELRQVGFLKPEVIGLFFVPPANKTAPRNPGLGNAYAALSEMYHYQAKKSRYQTVFDKTEGPVIDADAPFARMAVLPHAKTATSKDQAAAAKLAARALFHELLTPAGRVADDVRDVYRNAHPAEVPTVQTFGLFRLSWPRPEMLAAATRRFAQGQIQRWTTKEAGHLRESIAHWLAQQWEDRKLSLDGMIESLHGAVRAELKDEPDHVFDGVIDVLRTRTPSSGKIDAANACSVLEQLIKLVGKPDADTDTEHGSIYPSLKAAYERLTKETEGHLSVMAVTFIDVPQYRLAGAEEAVRQIAAKLKHQVEAMEPVQSELDKEVKHAYARLIQAIGGLGVRKPTSEVLDLLRLYSRKKFQWFILDKCLSVYRKLHGNAPEYLRELNFCRASLTDIQAALVKETLPTSDISGGGGKLILPDGCKNLDAAADQLLAGLLPEDLLEFEQKLQKEVSKNFRGIASICLKPVEKGPRFRELLMERARAFLDGKFDHSDPATIFFRYRPDERLAQPLLAEAFDEATPALELSAGAAKPYTINLLGVPEGPAGARLRVLAGTVLPNVELTAAPLPDDICFYREHPQIELTDLPQLGEFAREAYKQMTANNPPHARNDIVWQVPEPSAKE